MNHSAQLVLLRLLAHRRHRPPSDAGSTEQYVYIYIYIYKCTHYIIAYTCIV